MNKNTAGRPLGLRAKISTTSRIALRKMNGRQTSVSINAFISIRRPLAWAAPLQNILQHGRVRKHSTVSSQHLLWPEVCHQSRCMIRYRCIGQEMRQMLLVRLDLLRATCITITRSFEKSGRCRQIDNSTGEQLLQTIVETLCNALDSNV